MENYNEEQMREQMRRRQEMFKKMGAPNAGKVITESAVGADSTAAKLAAIRSGANKQDFSKYINAKSGNGQGSAPGGSFEALPEPKRKKNPNDVVNPEYSQQIEEFSAPRSSGNSELDAINAMFGEFGGGGAVSSRPSMGQPQNDFQMDIETANMPSFNPHLALQNKARKVMENQPDSPYLKFASNTPQPQYQQQQQQPQYQQPEMGGVNMANLQMMMETIAKGVAEKTIRNVLNEFSNQQKGKLQFEYYNKEKGIVKGSDGKLYRLQPVEIRKKGES